MEFFGIDLQQALISVGYVGLFAIIFAESGLLIGFFFPGDTLLFTAGLLASQGYFSISLIVVGCFIAAVSGDSVGYWFGQKFGPGIFKREDSLLFHKDHVRRAEEFYSKYGGLTIIVARFMPVIRTFAPILAGVGKMDYPTFLSFNVIGGLIWAVGIPLVGFYLGTVIPDIERYIIPILVVIVVGSFLPPEIEYLRHRAKKSQ